mmetsp:Transcript_34409/g.102118  ORF Transcript_34409/g.102118 Transcript_34409/m.102118 type:complete len:258 (+) Transcript_34409:58-831(+)
MRTPKLGNRHVFAARDAEAAEDEGDAVHHEQVGRVMRHLVGLVQIAVPLGLEHFDRDAPKHQPRHFAEELVASMLRAHAHAAKRRRHLCVRRVVGHLDHELRNSSSWPLLQTLALTVVDQPDLPIAHRDEIPRVRVRIEEPVHKDLEAVDLDERVQARAQLLLTPQPARAASSAARGKHLANYPQRRVDAHHARADTPQPRAPRLSFVVVGLRCRLRRLRLKALDPVAHRLRFVDAHPQLGHLPPHLALELRPRQVL